MRLRRPTSSPRHARIAVVSTPRSGNMWLRRLLQAQHGLDERSAHTPWEVDWAALPDRCVLQLHWERDRAFARLLRTHGFRVVVLARHPFDVLLSILQFAPHEPETARWLDGRNGDEQAIVGGDPASTEFRAYATGPRAGLLLGVSPQWWGQADVVGVRYESLVREPAFELGRIAGGHGFEPLLPAEEAIAAARFEKLQAEASNRHFWRGRPGHWRELMPTDLARELRSRHAAVLDRLGYAADTDGILTADEARRRWHEATRAQAAEERGAVA